MFLPGQLDGIKHVDELNSTFEKRRHGGLELSKRMFIAKRGNPQVGGNFLFGLLFVNFGVTVLSRTEFTAFRNR